MSLGLRRLPLWVLIAVVLLQPTPHRVSATVVGDLGDPMFLLWTVSWGAHALVNDPLAVFDAPIFFPEADTLAFSDPMLSLAPFFGVLKWVTGDAVTALNLMMFGLFVFALAAGHALGMWFFGRRDIALVVAVVSCCNSYVLGQQNHPQLQTVGFVTLSFLLLFRALERQRARDGVALGVCIVAMTLANLTYGLIWVFAAAVVVAVLGLQRALPPWRRLVRPAVPAALICAAVLGPMGLLYRSVAERNDLERPYEPAHSLFPTDVVTPQRGNWSWGTSLDGVNSWGRAGEHPFFPGFVVLLLGLVGVVLIGRLSLREWRARSGGVTTAPALASTTRLPQLRALLVAAAAVLVLAAGPGSGDLRLPFRLFHRYVPGFDGIRVTSRFAVVLFVVGALLVGRALVMMIERFPRWGRVIPWVVVVAVLIEVGGPSARVDVPEGIQLAAYETLRDQPDGVVLELPIRSAADGLAWPYTEAIRMYHSTIDFNPRINGYSGGAPAGFDALADRLDTWPSADAETVATELGIRYVVIHGGPGVDRPAEVAPEIVAEMIEAAQQLGYVTIEAGDDWVVIRG